MSTTREPAAREPAGAGDPHWHVEITAAVDGAAAIAAADTSSGTSSDSGADAAAEAVRTLRDALDYTLRLRGPVELTAPGLDRLRLRLTVAAPSLIAAIGGANNGAVSALGVAELRPGELVTITGRAPGEPAPAA
ncbi:hypothetical protein [Actinomadura sp. NPDC048394]|uniref:hypothetical protein n=1 Tax=Actinomadura sp. NPDC048394 TaxID=3158223 RepID=UPI0033D54167